MTLSTALALTLVGGACDLPPKNVGDESESAAKVCTPGEMMPAEDQCNTCECSEEGVWACTEKACEGTTGDTTDSTTDATTGDTTGDTSDGTSGGITDSTTGDASGDTSGGTTGDTTDTTDGTTGSTTGDVDPGFDPEDNGVQMCGEPLLQDPYEIIDPAPAIEGDMLLLTVAYSGGCAVHGFGLCWDGAFLESDPVQVNVVIPHSGEDDCDAYPSEALSFDLSDLKADWQTAYQQDNGTIHINLEGWGQTIEYTF